MSTIEVSTPRGNPVTLNHREGTTDLSTIGSIFLLWGQLHDEYGLGELHPKTFLDIGGHIGTVTVSVLVDNPECRAVVIEPLPENIDIIRANLESAGVADRAIVLEAGIGAAKTVRVGYTLARVPNADEVHRYVGSPVDDSYEGEAITVMTYTLGELIDMLGGSVDLLKVDCEGCEWVALADSAIKNVERIAGEYHGKGPDTVHGLLDVYFDVTTDPHDHGATGLFTAVRR